VVYHHVDRITFFSLPQRIKKERQVVLPAAHGTIPAIIPTIFPAAAGPATCASTMPAVAMKNVRKPTSHNAISASTFATMRCCSVSWGRGRFIEE